MSASTARCESACVPLLGIYSSFERSDVAGISLYFAGWKPRCFRRFLAPQLRVHRSPAWPVSAPNTWRCRDWRWPWCRRHAFGDVSAQWSSRSYGRWSTTDSCGGQGTASTFAVL